MGDETKSRNGPSPVKNLQLAEIFAMDEITHYNRSGGGPKDSVFGDTSLFGSFGAYDDIGRGSSSSDEDGDDNVSNAGATATSGKVLAAGKVPEDDNASGFKGSGGDGSSWSKPFAVSNTYDYDQQDHQYFYKGGEPEPEDEFGNHRNAVAASRAGAAAAGSRTPDLFGANSFVIDVKRADVVLDAFIFFIMCMEFVTDLMMGILHYRDGMTWDAGLTWLWMVMGGGSILHQFNHMERDQVKALFDRGKAIGILISCFPPLGTILCAYQSLVIGMKSTNDSMVSGRYLEIENFSKNLYKRQSFFQAAPQAALQMIIFMETVEKDGMTFGKGALALLNMTVSIIVMTNASIPSKAENMRFHVHLSPSQRMFIGIRMFSSFASRIMAVACLFAGLRCLGGSDYGLSEVMVAFGILLLPRLIFTFVEFARQLVLRGGLTAEGAGLSTVSPSSAFHLSSFQQILFGYAATILFPVGDPVWVFWYVWTESAVFVMIGNAIWWSMNACLGYIGHLCFTFAFIMLFLFVPVVVPYVKDSAKRMQVKRIQTLVHESTLEAANVPDV